MCFKPHCCGNVASGNILECFHGVCLCWHWELAVERTCIYKLGWEIQTQRTVNKHGLICLIHSSIPKCANRECFLKCPCLSTTLKINSLCWITNPKQLSSLVSFLLKWNHMYSGQFVTIKCIFMSFTTDKPFQVRWQWFIFLLLTHNPAVTIS